MSPVRALLSVCALVLVSAGTACGAWTWTPVDYPGAIRTYAYGVSGTDIVGGYKMDLNDALHGFVYDGARWQTLDYPEAINTEATGAWGTGIVGYYGVVGWHEHDFVYDGGTWTSQMYPGATAIRADAE
jgi:hypothetical protein